MKKLDKRKTAFDWAFEEYCDEHGLTPGSVPGNERRAFDEGWAHCWLSMCRKAGETKSPAKAKASRANGKMGGRPKKSSKNPQVSS